MSLIMITEAMRFIEEADAVISMEDKEFVAKYAFRTGDTDLVKKLIEELQEKDADREKVQTTRNKLYVAITRAKGNVYLIDEEQARKLEGER